MQTAGQMIRRLHDDRHAADLRRADERRRVAVRVVSGSKPGARSNWPLSIAVALRLISRPS